MNPEDENKGLAERLKRLRMQTGLSQKQFAQSVKLAYAQYNRYERGDNIPNADILSRLADALNISVDYLLEGEVKDAAVANFEDKDLLLLFAEVERLKAEDKTYIKKVVADLVKVKKFEQLAV
jgi:transcriptional regulator with XRE-family HTH domain